MYRISYRFSENLKNLHPYLKQNLQRRNYLPLKEFQNQAFRQLSNGRNIFLNSCTGSGKTLSYLVLIMNQILLKKESKQDQGPRGALILTLNKQLVRQIYREIKSLDYAQKLLVYQTCTLSEQQNETEDIFNSGYIANIFWNRIDILVSTPQVLINQLTVFKRNQKHKIDPEFLAVDQADLLLELDKNVSRSTDKIIKHIRNDSSDSSKIKYAFAASSFPKKYKRQEFKQKLESSFKTLVFLQGVNQHKFPAGLELYYIQMKKNQPDQLLEQKLSYLRKIIKDRMQQRLIIFCKNQQNIEIVCNFLRNQLKKQCVQYYAHMQALEREASLKKFDSSNKNTLVSSDLASRGLDFTLPIDCVIQFDMSENIVTFLNRAGRTARNGLSGQVICLVEEKNKTFFEHLKKIKSQNDSVDDMFSRKRSFSKSNKNSYEDRFQQNI